MLPTLYVILHFLRHYALAEYWVFMFLALTQVVIEQNLDARREPDDGDKVGDGHESHQKVNDRETVLQCHHGASKYNACRGESEEEYGYFLIAYASVRVSVLAKYKSYVSLTIEVAGNDGAVGKKQYGCC